jgi:hypothetical protein
MSALDFISKTSAALLVCSGWFVAYWSTVRRDRLSKQRDLRTQYLIEAYRRLESAGNRTTTSPEIVEALESAVADIQLLGSPEEAKLAREFGLNFAAQGRASLDPLLESLRASLRSELKLPGHLGPLTYLRISPSKESKIEPGLGD